MTQQFHSQVYNLQISAYVHQKTRLKMFIGTLFIKDKTECT